MKKVNQIIMPAVWGFVLCAVALQVVFGIAYICKNFGQVPRFYDTTMYLKMADTLVLDEYTGILYPLLIRLCKAVPVIPYQCILYAVQLGLGLYTVFRFADTWIPKKRISVLCAVYVNTIPFIAQAHVTVLPYALTFSCMVFMLLQVVKAAVEKRALFLREWAVVTGIYVVLAQLSRASLFVGGILLVWAAFLQLHAEAGKVRLFAAGMLVCISAFVCNMGLYHVTQTPGVYDRIQYSWEAVFFQRTGSSVLSEKYMLYMPQEIGDTFSAQDVNGFGKYHYQVEYEFGPILEDKYGRERANEIYRDLGKLALENAAKKTLLYITEDTLAYAVPLLSYESWQSGEDKGAVSWNYTQFMSYTPVLSSAYARICHALWGILFLMSVAVCFLKGVFSHKAYIRIWLPVLLFIGIYSLGIALETPAYDYKKALLQMAAGYVPICYMVVQYILKRFYEDEQA